METTRVRVLGALVVVALVAGCLEQGEDDPLAVECDARLRPSDVPDGAPAHGGPGPRLVTVTLADAQAPVTAWWPGANGTVEVVRLRTGEDGTVVVHAPGNVRIGLLGAKSAATAWESDGVVAPGSDVVTVALGATLGGSMSDAWAEPASAGFAQGPAGPSWQPTDLPWADADHLARLVSVTFTLAWENGAAGGADFGIAVGPEGSTAFHYRNAATQATAGPQVEERALDADELAGFAWGNITGLRAGPSVSTGAFATTGIPYTLSWQATFMQGEDLGDLCKALGNVRAVDVTS